jgi:tetratricopeptide (TPR) repeat protein
MTLIITEKIKKIIPAAVIISLALAGISTYSKIKSTKKISAPQFITEIKPNLNNETIKKIEDLLAEAENGLNNPPEGLSDEEKYTLNMQAGTQKYNLGKLAEAKDYFLAASALKPDDFRPYFSLYQVYMQMTDYSSARDSIKKVIALGKADIEIWKLYIQLEKEKFNLPADEMKQIYAQALKGTENNINLVAAYAQYLEEQGDLKGAIEQWKDAIKINPAEKDNYEKDIVRLEQMGK